MEIYPVRPSVSVWYSARGWRAEHCTSRQWHGNDKPSSRRPTRSILGNTNFALLNLPLTAF